MEKAGGFIRNLVGLFRQHKEAPTPIEIPPFGDMCNYLWEMCETIDGRETRTDELGNYMISWNEPELGNVQIEDYSKCLHYNDTDEHHHTPNWDFHSKIIFTREGDIFKGKFQGGKPDNYTPSKWKDHRKLEDFEVDFELHGNEVVFPNEEAARVALDEAMGRKIEGAYEEDARVQLCGLVLRDAKYLFRYTVDSWHYVDDQCDLVYIGSSEKVVDKAVPRYAHFCQFTVEGCIRIMIKRSFLIAKSGSASK